MLIKCTKVTDYDVFVILQNHKLTTQRMHRSIKQK
uniref:Uncharacterized protein n=1 Tax=Arundo donax TaxID=35708 RepID=A0A0A8ZH82_ARUDO